MELTIKAPVIERVSTQTRLSKAAEQVLLANGFSMKAETLGIVYRHNCLPISVSIQEDWPSNLQPFHYSITFCKIVRFNEKKGGCMRVCTPEDDEWLDPLQAIEEASDQLHKALVLALKIEQEFKNIQEATDIMEDDRL